MIVRPTENDKLMDKYFCCGRWNRSRRAKVLVAMGSAARLAISNPEAPVDATIVGIVDDENKADSKE